jgi:hypothetical protein
MDEDAPGARRNMQIVTAPAPAAAPPNLAQFNPLARLPQAQTQRPAAPLPGAPPGPASTTGAQPGAQVNRGKFVRWNEQAPGARLAETIDPHRMVIIHASFPYKRQMEIFRDALRYPTIADMVNDPNAPFAFRGFNVKRTVIATPSGPVPKEQQKEEDVNLENDYLPILLMTPELEPEDETLAQIAIFPGLYMRRPMLAKDHHYPAYKLPGIEKTVEDYKKLNQDLQRLVAKGTNTLQSRFGRGGNPIFDLAPIDPPDLSPEEKKLLGMANVPRAGTANLGTRPGMPGATPQSPYARTTPQPGYPAQAGYPPQPGQSTYAARPGVPGTGVPDVAATLQAAQQAQQAEWLPEHCLVRLVDVNVQAGYTYQYRIQVKMLNPSYKRRDLVAYDSLAEKPEIEGVWSPRIPAPVPPERLFYVVDQTTVDKSDIRTSGKEKGIGGANIPNPVASKDRAYVQIHRFLFEERLNPNDPSRHPIGDWSVDNRVEVHRGEYIGKTDYVEVPVWDEDAELFWLPDYAPKVRGGSRARPHGVPVDFNTEVLVVDFEGGRGDYTMPTGPKTVKRITDDSPLEMLVLTPEGKLEVHNSLEDTMDQARRDRLFTLRQWVGEIRGQELAVQQARMPKPAAGGTPQGNVTQPASSGGGGN